MLKLWCYLVLATFLFAFSCKQPKGGEILTPAPSNEVTITVKGDSNLQIKTPNTFKVNKKSTWKEVKQKAVTKIIRKGIYQIKEWRFDDEDGELLTDAATFNDNKTVFMVSKKRVKYKIEHLQENIEDDDFTQIEIEGKEGFSEEMTEAQAKQYDGFTHLDFQQQKINGFTVVKIKYKRNIISLIIDLDGGETDTKLEDTNDGKKLIKGKFGAEVNIKAPKKQRFYFDTWEPELPTHFPVNAEKVYTAKWSPKTGYRVTVEGDERVKVTAPEYIEVPIASNKKIKDIKTEILAKVSLKPEWSSKDYCFL